ncbi:MAG: YopX family protein [Bacteroidota bacterium]|nr:YopX family protein [Bacteroidota bacterium]
MRQFKFRAWDKDRGIMWYDDTMKFVNPTTEKYFNQNLVLRMDGDIRTCQWYDSGLTMHEFGHYELMQFTGLQDRHKKDIYDGDILLGYLYENEDYPYYVKVVYNEKETCYQLHALDDYRWPTRLTHNTIKDNHYEVIGNIYENDDLVA